MRLAQTQSNPSNFLKVYSENGSCFSSEQKQNIATFSSTDDVISRFGKDMRCLQLKSATNL